MQTTFSFYIDIPTVHPLLILQTEFHGTAYLNESGEVIIKEVFVKDAFQPYAGNQQLAVTVQEKQNMEGGEMGRFLGMCREAARKEFAKEGVSA